MKDRDALDYLKLDECLTGYVYRVYARNFKYGIFDGDHKFLGIQYEWGKRYLGEELHWDYDQRHGTVKPFEAIIRVPNNLVLGKNKKLENYLKNVLFFNLEV